MTESVNTTEVLGLLAKASLDVKDGYRILLKAGLDQDGIDTLLDSAEAEEKEWRQARRERMMQLARFKEVLT